MNSQRSFECYKAVILIKTPSAPSLLLHAVVLLQNILHSELFNEQQKGLIPPQKRIVWRRFLVAAGLHDDSVRKGI